MIYDEENKHLRKPHADPLLQSLSERRSKTDQWPAIKRLWHDGDLNNRAGETPAEIRHNNSAGFCAYHWLHSPQTSTEKTVARLQQLHWKCSAHIQPLIDAALEEILTREDER